MKHLGRRTSFSKRKLQRWDQIDVRNVDLIYMYVPATNYLSDFEFRVSRLQDQCGLPLYTIQNLSQRYWHM
jgi:hypothetical protein